MSDRVNPLRFEELLRWIKNEYTTHGSIFGISKKKFYHHTNTPSPYANFPMFGQTLETAFGPAAGPHTQLCQNIVAAYLAGSRFIELKTVQIMDDLKLEKPCIDASDEGYNTEWSQELYLEQSLDEYVKAWILIHLLKEYLGLSGPGPASGFIFNMSVGYDLQGIQSEKMDGFMNRMIDAKERIDSYLAIAEEKFPEMKPRSVPSSVANSVTISTMHGCPPSEIEDMTNYLIKEKGLNTYVKLNPTLLGKKKVFNILKATGYDYISIEDVSFEHDLGYQAALLLIRNLRKTAREHGKRFGIKLSNTLANRNISDILPGKERYMSGRALFPLTINLAYRLASEFDGKINISFSGGASAFNIKDILDSGIYPVTIATDILKPGGFMRLYQIARQLEGHADETAPSPLQPEQVNIERLKELSERSLNEAYYKKSAGKPGPIKLDSRLGFFDCIVAPCVWQCPIHQDVPEYIECIRNKDYNAALRAVLRKNPLPHITGFICDHACVEKCVRRDYDNPVHIRELKRFAARSADYKDVLSSIKAEIRSKKRNKKVAVIGSGPGGLAAGYFLAREGFEVTLFERCRKPGGTVRSSIPGFRLPDSVIDDDISLIRALGVSIKTEQNEAYSVEELKNSGFDYIIIATGATKARDLGILHENVKQGYYDGIDFLQKVKRGDAPSVGKSVLVIGGGNSAVDAARAAWRLSPGTVSIVYRRDLKSMPADREEIDACIEEGIKIRQLLQPYELVTRQGTITGLRCKRVKLGAPDESGRPRPIPMKGSQIILEAETVIVAVGEETEPDILHKNRIALSNGKTVMVDNETGLTSRADVYAVGDCVRGPATVVEAIADAKKIAAAILKKEGPETESFLVDSFYREGSEEIMEQCRTRHGEISFFYPVERLPLEKRESFSVVIQDLTEKTAARESERCLGCSHICSRCVETCPNRANIGLRVHPVYLKIPIFDSPNRGAGSTSGRGFRLREFRIEQSTQILHLDDFCNECGNCQTFCPHDGKPYRDKITLFSGKDLFENSFNSGFYPLAGSDDRIRRYTCRIDKTPFDLIIESGKGELTFQSPGFTLLFYIREAEKRLELKESFLAGSDIPDTASMIGLYFIAQTVFHEYSYLFNRESSKRALQ